MKKHPYVYAGAATLVLAVVLGAATTVTYADPKKPPKVPVLKFDPTWPKALPVAGQFGTPPAISSATGKPKPWVTGEVAGTCVDSQDHVFTVNRAILSHPRP
jgi:hypothetical protein